jgi:hypothetical protein
LREGIRVVAGDAEVEVNRAQAGDAVAEGTVPGMATRYGVSGRPPIRLRFPPNCEVQRGRFSARPGAVIRPASGTIGVATIESDKRDEGGEKGEQRLHGELLKLASDRGSGDSAF